MRWRPASILCRKQNSGRERLWRLGNHSKLQAAPAQEEQPRGLPRASSPHLRSALKLERLPKGVSLGSNLYRRRRSSFPAPARRESRMGRHFRNSHRILHRTRSLDRSLDRMP